MTKMQSANRSSSREATAQVLQRDERCAAAARQFVAEQLGSGADETELSNALLVVSELATNAYRHGRGRIEVRVHRRGRSVRIEVLDEGADTVRKREAPGGVTGGWGLRVVEEIAVAWGSTGGPTRVWADLPLHAPSSVDAAPAAPNETL